MTVWFESSRTAAVFYFLGKRPVGRKTDISMITDQSRSQNSTALYLNLLIMDDHNNYDRDEILSKYWRTDTPSSASDDSGDTEDELMDLTGIFIALICNGASGFVWKNPV